ncbi:hypothetical protein AAK943_07250 [Emergencia timonensis]
MEVKTVRRTHEQIARLHYSKNRLLWRNTLSDPAFEPSFLIFLNLLALLPLQDTRKTSKSVFFVDRQGNLRDYGLFNGK